ncbi:MAG: carboxypeptidase regulatory-like domain-containing protein, partial [Acidimicrobiales bacterium]|nr:carboxypeptidase regulatory-like domain-containing protein [Acidimicrobiales bacterium]
QMHSVGSLNGRVVNPDGSPAVGVLVLMHDSEGNTVSSGTTGSDGTFSVEVVTAGTYTAALVPASDPDSWQDIGGDTPKEYLVTDGRVFVGPILLTSGLPYGPADHGRTTIGGGDTFTCALGPSGTVECWGENETHELGDGGNEASSSTPVTVTGITDAVNVTVGNHHACAAHADGTVSCWGDNSSGQLGDGTYNTASTPVTVTGITDAVAVTAGFSHSCALHAGGSVSCWGEDLEGQLGNGTTGNGSATPVSVSGLLDATAVSAGDSHTCAIHVSGTVSCWGWNEDGELGNGHNTDSNVPVTVTGITDATQISGGALHTCALHATGTISCWGGNTLGQLGDGNTVESYTPVNVSGLTSMSSLAAGSVHTCASRTNGSVFCWGSGPLGELGNGTWNGSSSPVAVTGLSDGAEAAAGTYHSCVRRYAGRISCWGFNNNGQLGDGTNDSSSTPVGVVGFGP